MLHPMGVYMFKSDTSQVFMVTGCLPARLITATTHVTQQIELGVSHMELRDNELIVTFDPPLQMQDEQGALPPKGGPVAAPKGFMSRIKKKVWPW